MAETNTSKPNFLPKNFTRTGDTTHNETNQNQYNVSKEAVAGDDGVTATDASRKFAPRQATPTQTLFTSIEPVSRKSYFDDGSKTQDFVADIARSNASYLKWTNRFNANFAGSSPV